MRGNFCVEVATVALHEEESQKAHDLWTEVQQPLNESTPFRVGHGVL